MTASEFVGTLQTRALWHVEHTPRAANDNWPPNFTPSLGARRRPSESVRTDNERLLRAA
jgi:hypothetical protein